MADYRPSTSRKSSYAPGMTSMSASASTSQVVSPGGSASPVGANRTDQIVHRVYIKTVGILVDGRITYSGRTGIDDKDRKKDKWFNIIIPEADIYKADLQLYKSISSFPSTPDGASTVPPLLVAFILDTSDLPSNQALMWHRDSGKVTLDTGKLGGKGKGKERKGSGIVLERWTFEANNASIHPSASQIASHTAYRMGIIHFRSLFALVRLLPAYKLYRRLRRANNGLRLGLKVWSPEGYPRDEAGLREAWEVMEQDLISLDTGLDTLVTAPDVERDQDSQRYELPSLDLFGVEYRLSVDFRPDVDFHVDDLESVLSEKLVDMEEDWFTPTVARHRMDETSSNPSSSATSSNPPSRRVGTPTTIPSSNPAPIPQRQGPASIGSFQTGALPGSRNRQASAQSQKGTDAVNERWGAIGEGLPFATATGGDNRASPGSAISGAAVTARRLSGHSIHPFTSSSPSTSYLRGSPSGMTQGPSPTLAPRPAIAHSSSIGRTSSFLSQSGRSFTHAQLANMHPSSASPPVTGAMSREHLPLGSSPNAAQPTSPSSLSFSKQPLPRSLSGRPPYTAQGSSPFIPGSFERDSTMPVSGQPHQVVRKYSSTLGQGQRARVSSYGSSGGEGSSVPTTGNQNLLRRSSTRMSTESGLRHSLETPDPAAINVPDDDDIQSFLKTLDSLPQPPSLAAQAATSRARQPSASSSLSNTSLRQANSPQPSNSPSPLPTGAGALAARTPVTRAQVDDAVRRMTGSFATHAKSLEQSRIMPPLSPDEISPRFDPSPSNRSSSGTTSVGLLTASRPLPASRRVSPSALHGPTDSSSPPTGRSASVKKNSPLSGEPLQPPTPGPPYRPGPDPRAVQTALPSSPPPVSAATQAKAAARSLPIGQAPLAEDSPVPVRAGHPTSGFLSPQPTGSSKRDTSATNQSQRRGPVLLRGGFDGRSQSPSQSKAGQRQSVSPSRSPIRDFSRLAVAAGPSRIPASISAGGGVGAVGGGEHHAEAELNGWRRYRSEQRIQMAGTTNAAPGQQGTGVRRQSVGTANVLESAATGAERVTGSAGAGAEGAQGQRTAPSSLGRYRDKGSGGDE